MAEKKIIWTKMMTDGKGITTEDVQVVGRPIKEQDALMEAEGKKAKQMAKETK
ncbi:unnamed protein product [marine sediment metagenome]|uniref:Uncharacterized protein n=1 Tax=marine sediment metagenome TaxID=412755 RepID=X1BII5_9ZZZZ